jgi:type I restriction enzyme S subunit
MAKWKTSPLAAVCTVFGDGDWIESKDQSPEGVRLVQTGNVGEGEFKDRAEKARFISQDTFTRLRCTEIFTGDCLISRLPDPVGRACLIPETGERMITAVDCTIVRFDQSKLLPEFFVHYSQAGDYLAAVERESTGTTRKRISRARLGQIPVPLPPLSEQRRIVAILDEAFEVIATAKANTEKNLQSTREVFRVRLRSIFGAVEGQPLPDGWYETHIGTLGIVQSGAGFPLAVQRLVDGGIPFYKVSDMNIPGNEREMLYENNSVTETARKKLGASIFPRGSVIFPKIGGAIATNKKRIATRDCCVDNNVMGVIPRLDKVTPAFLFLFFLGRDLSDFANEAHLPSIRKTVVENWKVSVPRSLDEQTRIASELELLEDQVESLERICAAKLAALDELKKSLLRQAFTGQMTAKFTDQQLTETA